MTEPTEVPDPQENRPGFAHEEIQDMIDQAVARSRAEMNRQHSKDMEALRASLSGVAPSPVATHAGGPDNEIAPTWSGYDQLLSTQGEHPWQRQEHADWLVNPEFVENRQPQPWTTE